MNPLVSVIIPVYNGELYLREALDSIFAQTYHPIEVIVVDDGSTDGSAFIAQSYPQVRYIKQENQGCAIARTRGIDAAKGDLITFLDQDDYWNQDKTLKQVNAFQLEPELQIVIGKARYFADEKSPPPSNLKQSIFESDRISYVPGVLMVKKGLLEKIPLDQSNKNGSDTDWFFRVREQNVRIHALSDILLSARMHQNNASHDVRQYSGLLSIIRASIQRMKPLVSVIVPVYNGEKYLKGAIDSILTQTFRSVEIVLVDDGSTDRTAEVAGSFGDKIRYVYQKNAGIGAGRNSGIEFATGTYLAFLDADDLWTESKLMRQLELFQKNPNLDMVFGEALQFFSPDMAVSDLAKYKSLPPQMPSYFAGTMLIKRSSFEKVGLFSTTVQVGEFIDWYCRAKESNLIEEVLPELVLKRRIHGANTSLQKKEHQSDFLHILHSSLQRRKVNR